MKLSSTFWMSPEFASLTAHEAYVFLCVSGAAAESGGLRITKWMVASAAEATLGNDDWNSSDILESFERAGLVEPSGEAWVLSTRATAILGVRRGK